MLIFRAIEGFFYVLRPTFVLYSGMCACRKALMVSISQRSVPFPTKLHSVFHVFHYIEPAMRRKFMERLMLGLSWLGICDCELKSFNIYCLSKTNTTMIWQRFISNSRTYKKVESCIWTKKIGYKIKHNHHIKRVVRSIIVWSVDMKLSCWHPLRFKSLINSIHRPFCAP